MIVTESFLLSVNGVTGSVLRVLEHLRRHGHPALVVAPEGGPDEHEGTPVVRVPAVSIPGVSVLPVGLPSRRLQEVMAGFAPDVVHLASPFVLGASGLAAARRLGLPTVAVYQTDLAGFVRAYGVRLTGRTAWRWMCRLHKQADRTLAPSTAAVEALVGSGVERVHRIVSSPTSTVPARAACAPRCTTSATGTPPAGTA
jgi:phosphatidylinositol alpha 1,6-mannosyltransferase